ncbi:hypothetical protein [Microcoleus sp. S13C4]|uniref:hypothetical protein n=1 Tax=Microcoleus sp. S13C4 TaxID=3055410 RepID=UPI002FD65FBE
MGQRVAWLYLFVRVDRGDSGQRFLKSMMDSLGWIIQVVVRSHIQGFVLLKKRALVEQNFGGFNLVSRVEQVRSAIIGWLTGHDIHLLDSVYRYLTNPRLSVFM